jgi:predicted transcriptional regulator
MNREMPTTVQEALQKLLHYGFQECTEEASKQDDMEYLYAFERPGEEKSVCYCCETEEDLFALLALVEDVASS